MCRTVGCTLHIEIEFISTFRLSFIILHLIMLRSKLCGLFKQRVSFPNVWQAARLCSHDSEPPKMEKTLNEVTLIGRAGGEPQKRGSEEHPVIIFSLATHTNYTYESGKFAQRTDWHRICVFKPSLRDTVYNYLKKGQRIYVAGRLTYGEVKGEDGKPRTTSSVIADDVIFFQ